MPNYCKLTVIGHLTRDIETRFTPNQVAVASSGIAFSHKYKDKEDTCFLDWTAFGKTGETLAKYLSKGSAVLLEGRLTLDQWEDRESGAKRSKHKMIVESFVFMPKKDQGQRQERQGPPPDDDPEIPF